MKEIRTLSDLCLQNVLDQLPVIPEVSIEECFSLIHSDSGTRRRNLNTAILYRIACIISQSMLHSTRHQYGGIEGIYRLLYLNCDISLVIE